VYEERRLGCRAGIARNHLALKLRAVRSAIKAPNVLAPVRERLKRLSSLRPDLRWRAPPLWFVLVLLIAILTWPINPNPPTSGGYDISWITALSVAAHQGLHWGSQMNYTYGPLGYLTTGNLFYDRTGIPADLVIGAIYVGLLAVIARPLCRALGLVVGGLLLLVLAHLAASPIDPVELLAPLMVALGILALRRGPAELRPAQAVGISALAAFSALDKLSAAPVGFAIVVVLAIVAAARPGATPRERLRGAGIFLGSYVVALLVLWLLAGQSLFDLPAYIRNAYDIIGGYDDAQSLPNGAFHYLYKWVLISSLIALAFAVWRDWGLALLNRVAIIVLWLLYIYVAFRHGFVREDLGHSLLFFALMALLSAGVLVGPGRLRAGVVACLVPLALVWHLGSWNVPAVFNVASGQFVADVNLLLGPNGRHAVEGQSAHALAASYGFPPALVARISGETVQFDPWEAAIAWAFPQIHWDPAPVFQSYNAYTAHLDDINAGFLAGPRAPRYVLRQNLAQDNRDPRFESPRYMLTMMCRYRQVMTTTSGWELLEHGPDRCGAPVPAGSERVRFGQRVFVPAPTPDSIVVASFTDFSLPLSDTIEKLLFRRPPWYISTNATIYRFVPGHASNPHVMSFPACLGWSPGLFDPTPYRWIGIGHLPQLATPGATESSSYLVSFERIPFRCNG